MKVLLTTLNAKYIHINLAVRLLYQLNKDKHNIAYKEFSIKEDFDAIADYCSRFEILAFSCYIWNITQTIAVVKKIKAINPTIKILLGGPEVSYEWDKIIAINEIDFIITIVKLPTYLMLQLASIMILPALYLLFIPIFIYNDNKANANTNANNYKKKYLYNILYYYLGFIIYYSFGSLLSLAVYIYTFYYLDDLNWNSKKITNNIDNNSDSDSDSLDKIENNSEFSNDSKDNLNTKCFKINKTCNCIKCFFTLNCFCKISKKQNSKKLKNIISSDNIITNIEKLKKSIDVSELWDDSNI